MSGTRLCLVVGRLSVVWRVCGILGTALEDLPTWDPVHGLDASSRLSDHEALCDIAADMVSVPQRN